MGKKKGDSFVTGPPFEIIVGLVFAFLIIAFVISQAGGLSAIMEMICENVPQLCTTFSTLEYQSANKSTQRLICAINTALSRSPQCMGVVTTGLGLAGAVTAESGEIETTEPEFQQLEYEIDYVMTEDMMLEGCEEECDKKMPKCDCIRCTKKEIDTKEDFKLISDKKYRITCDVVYEGEEIPVYCDFIEGYPELEYEEDRNFLKSLGSKAFNVYYLFVSGEWKWKSRVTGMGDDEFKPLSEMTAILNKLDGVHTYIHEKLVNINQARLENEDKFERGLEVFRETVLDERDEFGQDDEVIAYLLNGETKTFNKKDIDQLLNLEGGETAICKVYNFELPETFGEGLFSPSAWKEFINGFGDPSFLVYYQQFPMGEDTDWSSQSEWFKGVAKVMFDTMCLFDAFRFLRAARIKAAVKVKQIANVAKAKMTKLSERFEKLKSKLGGLKGVSENTKAMSEFERLHPEVAGKVHAKEYLSALGRGQSNRAVVDSFRDEVYAGMTRKQAWVANKAALEKAGKEFTESQWKAYEKAFTDVWNGKSTALHLTEIMVDKASPSLMKKLFGKINLDVLSKAAKYAGVTYGVSYYMARVDSELGKFIEEYPNHLILGIPLKREEPVELHTNVIPKDTDLYYPDKQNLVPLGRPVILIKTEHDNQPTSFYLASPCKAHLTINSQKIKCGVYTYDSLGGMTACETPDADVKEGWWERAVYGTAMEIPECGSLLVGRTNPEKKKLFSRFSDKAVEIVENMGYEEVYGGEVTVTYEDKGITVDRVKVVDPFHGIEFYYDKENKVIDGIGAKMYTGSGYEKKIYSMDEFFKNASDNGGKQCWYINDRSDEALCITFSESMTKDPTMRRTVRGYVYEGGDKRLVDYPSVTVQDPHRIVNSSDDIKGYPCYAHEIGNVSYNLTFYKKIVYDENENEIEKLTIGEGGMGSGNVYFRFDPGFYFSVKEVGIDGASFSSSYTIYFDEEDDFYAISKFTHAELDDESRNKHHLVLRDSNYDGKIDEFGQYFVDIAEISKSFGWAHADDASEAVKEYPEGYYQRRIFTDKNFDGETDSIISTNCQVPGAVTIEADRIGVDENDNNYCYKTTSGAWQVGSTVLIMGSAALGRSGAGVVASMAISCGVAAINHFNFLGIARSKWPSGK